MSWKVFFNSLYSRFKKWRLELIHRFSYGDPSVSLMTEEEPPIRTGGGTLP